MKIPTALREFDWKGWLGWVAATLAGVELVALSIFLYFTNSLDKYWWGYLATASAAGISLGACQWIWLRRKLVKAWWWIVSTLLGWYLAALLVKVLDANDSGARGTLRQQLVGVIGTLALPLALSLPQWFLIRRRFQKRAWWWIVARPLAWLTGLGLLTLGDYLHILPAGDLFSDDLSTLAWVGVMVAVFGFGFAAVTGAAFTCIQTDLTVRRSHAEAGR